MDQDNNLYIDEIKEDNGGKYYCYGYDDLTEASFLSSKVVLIVIGKPMFMDC